jgi:uncharacterized protein (TIGR03437 family)
VFGTLPLSGALVVVSAASYSDNDTVAADSVAAAFGKDFSGTSGAAEPASSALMLGDTSVRLIDSAGLDHEARLLSLSAGQVNFNVPSNIPIGKAQVSLVRGEQTIASGDVIVTAVAPGLFAADGSGIGPAAANAIRVRGSTRTSEPVARFESGRWSTVPIDLGPNTDQVVLVLYGTGIRARSRPSAVTATIGKIRCDVLYAGPSPGFVGVDQINVLLEKSLSGLGELDLELIVDGRTANTLRVNIK